VTDTPKAAREETVTPEVGGEGGTPGDIEIVRNDRGTGSEATETWYPAEQDAHEVVRDETGEGRRSP
jgi:hypothetical protein